MPATRPPPPCSRRSRGTTRGRSCGARATPATATRSRLVRRPERRGRVASSTYRSSTGRPTRAAPPTACWRSPSARSPSAASRRTTTAPRWSSSTSTSSGSSRRRGIAGRDHRRRHRVRSTAAASRSTTSEYAEARRGDHRRRDRPGRGRQPRDRAPLPRRRSPTGAPTRRSPSSSGCCERERGAYWTFCFFTGDRYLVGASPERHVSVQGGYGTVSDVRMNPISGTFRLAGHDDPAERKAALLDFLADEKEIYELFMVVDEELKMMCDICHEGGQVLGPFLKPMTHLVHTEYLLAGRTRRDVREVLRDTMYAATVTGSPVAERLPADQAVRDRGPRLLRRRARPDRPRPRGPDPVRQPDRHPRRGRRPRRPPQGDRRAPPWSATATR